MRENSKKFKPKDLLFSPFSVGSWALIGLYVLGEILANKVSTKSYRLKRSNSANSTDILNRRVPYVKCQCENSVPRQWQDGEQHLDQVQNTRLVPKLKGIVLL